MTKSSTSRLTAAAHVAPLYVAPMEGLTGFVYRRVHLEHFGGADAYWIPFVTPTVQPQFTERQMRELAPAMNAGFRAVPQLLTSRAEDFIWAAKALADLGYDEVNLNVGCPAGTVVAKGKGSGFLRTPVELEGFLSTIFEADLPIAISVKTRIGYADEREFDLLSDVFNHFPMKALTIHPRLKTDMYKGDVRMHVFEDYWNRFDVPVGYNGDIVTCSDALRIHTQHPGLDHIMIGRALMADPALLRKLRGGPAATLAEIQTFNDALLDAYDLAFGNRKNAIMRMKEYWFFLANLFENSQKAVKAVFKSRTPEDYAAAIANIYDNHALLDTPVYGWRKPL